LNKAFDPYMTMQTPVIDGFAATRMRRANAVSRFRLLLTANAMIGFEQQILKSVKPPISPNLWTSIYCFTLAELLRSLKRQLSNRVWAKPAVAQLMSSLHPFFTSIAIS
jgi:hypothetical protein